jgi:Fe-S oxidoreductase
MNAPLGSEVTRQIFWGVSPALKAVWYALAILSVFVFAYGVLRPLAKYLRGDRSQLPPVRELRGRLGDALRTVISHATVARRDRFVGWAHRGIFAGFLVLFAGTIVLGLDTDVTEPLFGWRFYQGDFYRVYSFVLDLAGIPLIVGLVMMLVRRAALRPAKLDYTRPDRSPEEPQYDRRRYRWGDWAFLGGLLYLTVTGYMLEGVRIAMDGSESYAPVGSAIGSLMSGLGREPLDVIRHVLWWTHGLVAISIVAAIPYTKASHMLTDFVSLVLRDHKAGKRLPPEPDARPDGGVGYGTLGDFSVAHLLQLDACTRCGRCHEVCPANAVGMPLSPRDVVLELREQANVSMAGVGIGGVLGMLARPGAGDATEVVGDSAVRADTIWSCMQCNACVEICPVGIEQAPIINLMRRRLVDEGELDPALGGTLRVIQRSGNSFGENRRRRGRWTRELDFEVADARRQAVDVLWFVGDYASFDPRSQEVTRTIARLLHAAEVDFGILYEDECNSGNDVRRVGEESLFEDLASSNVEALAQCEFGRVMTSDPHSLNTLRNEYPDFGAAYEVLHHTELLLELLRSGRLSVQAGLCHTVTYHDPCHLGRLNGDYEAPREILEALGCALVEMPRNRDNSFCCGAGGGQIWIGNQTQAERPSENRIREALALEGVELFVVCCPKDVTMYEDAIKTTGSEAELELREIAELVAEAVLRAPALA